MSNIKLTKLSLNKEIIAKLHDSQMQGVRGGAGMSTCALKSCKPTCADISCCDKN